MDKSMVTRSFEGVWKDMSRNKRGILLPPPILEAINLRNPGGKDELLLFEGNELRHDLTRGLVAYLRAYVMDGVQKVDSYSEGNYAQVERMRLDLPEFLEDVLVLEGMLPLRNRVGIVGFENYFDIMDPEDLESYRDLVGGEDGLDNFYGYL